MLVFVLLYLNDTCLMARCLCELRLLLHRMSAYRYANVRYRTASKADASEKQGRVCTSFQAVGRVNTSQLCA